MKIKFFLIVFMSLAALPSNARCQDSSDSSQMRLISADVTIAKGRICRATAPDVISQICVVDLDNIIHLIGPRDNNFRKTILNYPAGMASRSRVRMYILYNFEQGYPVIHHLAMGNGVALCLNKDFVKRFKLEDDLSSLIASHKIKWDCPINPNPSSLE